MDLLEELRVDEQLLAFYVYLSVEVQACVTRARYILNESMLLVVQKMWLTHRMTSIFILKS